MTARERSGMVLAEGGVAAGIIEVHTFQGEVMTILWAIIIGLFVGVIAKFLMPGRDPGGFIITTLVGIGGAVVASLLGRSLGWYRDGETAGFIASILGAMLLLFLYRMLRRSPAAVPK